jgi:RimJ/RimL family protein N-acetyltransferase
MQNKPVIIETERLILRPHHMGDLPECFAMWKDPLVTQFIGGKPFTENQTWMKVLGYRGHWELMGYGYWAVEEKSSRSYIGELGFGDFRREIVPKLTHPELGWALCSKSQGKGYATEGLQAALRWMEDKHKTTVCIIDPENLRSLHLAKKLGFKEQSKIFFQENSLNLLIRN